MKRYYSSFFFLLTLLFIGYKASGTSFVVHPIHRSESSIVSDIPHAFPVSSMREKKPHNDYTVILFRLGIEGKSHLISYHATVNSIYIGDCITDIALTNRARIKHILLLHKFLALMPEFLSAFSFHAPPILS